jgi:opine dehydrogenase
MVDQPIAVLGGGNGGHAMAADLTLRGFKVKFYEMPKFEENVRKVLATKRIRVIDTR